MIQKLLLKVKAWIDRRDAARVSAREHARRSLFCGLCRQALYADEIKTGYCAVCWSLKEPEDGPRPLGMKAGR